MIPDTLLTNVRVIDPQQTTDFWADVLISNGQVQKLGDPGSSTTWPEHPDDIHGGPLLISGDSFDGDLILMPGLVDIHTHVYGAAGVQRADQLGTEVGVPTIVDAGGAGAATIDDFAALRAQNATTRVRSLLAIEAGGIVDNHILHNTTRTAQEMVTPSIDAFIGAIERHQDDVVGLKLWASAKAGTRWLDFGVSLSEMTGLPIMVHIGDDTAAQDQMHFGSVVDRLQGGDIVTHCFTALTGGIIDQAGRISNEAIAARARGVNFDVAPGLINLSFDRAVAAMEQGWLPDTISSDAHRWSVEGGRAAHLPQVMGSFLALGLSLAKTIECASVNAAAAVGVTTGRPVVGSEATLSLLHLRTGAAIFSDGTTSIRGDETLEPVGCFIEGAWIEAGARSVVDVPQATRAEAESFIAAVADELSHHRAHDERWRGAELHQLVHRARRDSNLCIPVAMDALFGALSEGDSSVAAGWLIEQLGPDDSLSRLMPLVPSGF